MADDDARESIPKRDGDAPEVAAGANVTGRATGPEAPGDPAAAPAAHDADTSGDGATDGEVQPALARAHTPEHSLGHPPRKDDAPARVPVTFKEDPRPQ